MPSEHVGPRGLRRLLESVASISSDLELQVVLRRVVDAAVELVDARYGALGVLDETGGGLAEFITAGIDDATRLEIGDLPKGLGLLGSIIRDARPMRLADLHEHSDSVGFPHGHPPMTSFLGVPIRVRDQVFGNLYLTEKTTGEVFTDVDEELALALASAAAVAIDNARLFERTRLREATLAAMHEVSAALLSGVEPAESLHLVARHARELVQGDLATIALPVGDGATIAIDVADGPLWEEMGGQRFPTAGSVSGEVLRDGEMIVLEDASQDYRVSQPQVGGGHVGPAVWVALMAEGLPFGTLSVARSPGAAPFTSSELELVRSFAAQASVILEHDRARQNLQRLSDLEAGDRMARDLHDTVIQRLFAIGMSLQGTIQVVTEPYARERVTTAVEDLDVTIRHIRTVIFGLGEIRPGCAPGLRAQSLQLSREAARLLGFEPELIFHGPVDTIVGETIAEDLLATLRETLANIARHAHAQHASISISAQDGVIALTVQDDGVGIDLAAAETSAGHGLNNMRARAERHGGRLSIEPGDNGGTVLSWQLPLPAGG